MFIPFDKLPQEARVWIYQTARELSNSESEFVNNYLQSAVESWTSHSSNLLGSFQVLNNRFIVIAADENFNAASGCSIDSSTRWLKDLTAQLNIDFFDRSQAYLENGEVKTFSIFQAKKTVEEGKISPETILFNNNITNLKDFQEKWQMPAAESFMKKYWALV